ncbi:MAG: P63C domain-containing protein [Flavobacteriales bacterium]|nr:P63C domain-containing protein [Flavobacteriales bacterium]
MTKLPKATHGSEKTPLTIGDIKIPCYVLDDGTRVLSGRGIQKSLGTTATSGAWLQKFVNKPEIKAHLPADILNRLNNPIEFERKTSGGSQSSTYGYEATLLIDIIDAIIDASRTGSEIEVSVVDSAYFLSKALKKVSIIALIDEATGYQYDRERFELQAILKAYISEELLKWQKTFPDTFYQEVFRLNGWDYTVNDIKKRPGVVGKWTNKVIYEQLPNGVLDELKTKTPKSKSGNPTARYFQSLTADVGHPHLSAQLNQVIAIMRISDNWKEFMSNFNKMVARKNGQLELKYEDLEYKEDKEPVKNEFLTTLKAISKVPPPKR